MPRLMPPGELAAAVDAREEDAGDADCEKLADKDDEEEHRETLLARLRGGGTAGSRRSLGRPERSWAGAAVSGLGTRQTGWGRKLTAIDADRAGLSAPHTRD
jgi:hypothetical protein